MERTKKHKFTVLEILSENDLSVETIEKLSLLIDNNLLEDELFEFIEYYIKKNYTGYNPESLELILEDVYEKLIYFKEKYC